MAFMPVRRDAATASFFEGTARGEFLLIRDNVTGELLDPRTDTSYDRDRFTVVAASGRATVVSWSVVHTRLPDRSTQLTLVGIVQLEEGPWWWTELRGLDSSADLLGQPLHVAFERSGSGADAESIPYFTASEH